MFLLSTNTKINKTNKSQTDYFMMIMQLAPYNTSGYQTCPSASKSCSAECIFYAGYGKFPNVQKARIDKTKLFFEDRALFLNYLHQDLTQIVNYAEKNKRKAVVRLNGFSDIPWYEIDKTLFEHNIQYIDYTKVKKRYIKFLDGEFPENYHLTFSRSETNEQDCLNFLRNYKNAQIAVVFERIPKTWHRFAVENGDAHDLRWLDKKKICGLSAKGRAKKDLTGFVVR